MKIRFSIKDPDAFYDGFKDAGMLGGDSDFDDLDRGMKHTFNTFVQFNEYAVIEIDFETFEARVVPVNEW
jgi:hypothetical protein